MTVNPYRLTIIGAGISGLCCGLRALELGLSVEIITKDEVSETTSAMSAGMIAPTLEALFEPNPMARISLYRMAQSHWTGMAAGLGLTALLLGAKPAVYVFDDKEAHLDSVLTKLSEMGARAQILSDASRSQMGIDPILNAVEIEGEWMMDAPRVLDFLKEAYLARGGLWRLDTVDTITKLDQEGFALHSKLSAPRMTRYLIIAGGYQACHFAPLIPALSSLNPIKGHIVRTDEGAPDSLIGRIVRASDGYFAYFAQSSCFGATMQVDQDDDRIEQAQLSLLLQRAQRLKPIGFSIDIDHWEPMTGIRASTPDGLPILGCDRDTGIGLCVGMRRNGWLFAPYAANLIMAQLLGGALPDRADQFDPERFATRSATAKA